MVVPAGLGVVEGLAADRAEACAVLATEQLRGQGQRQGVVGPGPEADLPRLDVRALEVLAAAGLVDLAGIDRDLDRGVAQTAHAGPLEPGGVTQAKGVAGGHPGDVEAGARKRGGVGVTAVPERAGVHLEVEAPALPRAQLEASEVDRVRCGHVFESRVARAMGPPDITGGRSRAGGQFHWRPDSYLEEIQADVPRYDELQDAAVAAIPSAPERVLELGVGTGETTRRLLAAHPQARVTGLDGSPEMVFRARELGIEVRLARMEDPLPDGPWDLVIGVLSVHHLDDEGKRDLFRRVREQSRAVVVGDVVLAEPQITRLEAGVDLPSGAAEQAQWCGGEVVWTADDLAVIRAVYD
jgi:tRNA (cmo5U34)-methyltransferase